MNYSIEYRDKIVIFTLKHAKLNSDIAPKFKAELLIICQPDIEALIIDLSMVEVIESAGLGCLLLAHRQLNEYATPVMLVGVQKMVKSLIEISQIEHLFEYYDTVEDAINSYETNIED